MFVLWDRLLSLLPSFTLQSFARGGSGPGLLGARALRLGPAVALGLDSWESGDFGLAHGLALGPDSWEHGLFSLGAQPRWLESTGSWAVGPGLVGLLPWVSQAADGPVREKKEVTTF